MVCFCVSIFQELMESYLTYAFSWSFYINCCFVVFWMHPHPQSSSVNLIFFSPHLYLNKYMGNVGVFVFPFTHCVSELVVLFANSKRSWLKRYFLGYLLYTQCRIPVCNLHAVEVVKCLVRTLFAQVSL